MRRNRQVLFAVLDSLAAHGALLSAILWRKPVRMAPETLVVVERFELSAQAQRREARPQAKSADRAPAPSLRPALQEPPPGQGWQPSIFRPC